MAGEEPLHLICGLDVELLARELHPVGILVEFADSDAQQHVVHPGIVPRGVVRIVGRDERDPRLFVEPDQTLIDALLPLDAMVLHLEIYVIEDLHVLKQEPPRLVGTPLQYPGRHLRREAAREADDPTPVPPERLHIDPWLVVEALQKPAGRELHEVPVALCGPGDQRQMIVRCAAPVVAVDRNVDFASHQGLYSGVSGLFVELDRPVHHTVVVSAIPGILWSLAKEMRSLIRLAPSSIEYSE